MSKPLKILECFGESVGDRCASARKIAKMTSQRTAKNFRCARYGLTEKMTFLRS